MDAVQHRVAIRGRYTLNVYANFGQDLLRCNSFVFHDLPFGKNSKNIKALNTVSHCETCSYIAPVKNLTHHSLIIFLNFSVVCVIKNWKITCWVFDVVHVGQHCQNTGERSR